MEKLENKLASENPNIRENKTENLFSNIKNYSGKIINKAKKGFILGLSSIVLGSGLFYNCEKNSVEPNIPPEAQLVVKPNSGYSPLEVNISLDGTDLDGKEDIIEYKLTAPDTTFSSENPINIKRTYNQDATIKGSVKDSHGETDSKSVNVDVQELQGSISLNVDTLNYVDIKYDASISDIEKAVLKIMHEDTLSQEIEIGGAKTDTLKNMIKGNYDFILECDEGLKKTKNTQIPNYKPEADFSGLEGKLNFTQGGQLALALPVPEDKNPEDNPVHYTDKNVSDEKTNAEVRNYSLFVSNKEHEKGVYQLKLEFGSSEGGFNKKNLEGEILPYETPYFNPFKRPSNTTLYYGSGDVDGNGVINQNDLDEIISGVVNDMSDIDGDGTASTQNDRQILEDYINGNKEYLPGHWEKLQSREERDSWLEKMLAIDKTDEHEVVQDRPGVPIEERFISGNFATQLCLNFYGFDKEVPWTKYDLSNLRRFNLPVYFMKSIVEKPDGSTEYGHGMNAILTEDNALDFNSWNFIEPAPNPTEATNVKPRPYGHNMSSPGRLKIYAPNKFSENHPDMLVGEQIITFEIDSLGNTSYFDCPQCKPPVPHPDLVYQRN